MRLPRLETEGELNSDSPRPGTCGERDEAETGVS
jgi:hypothetical protein